MKKKYNISFYSRELKFKCGEQYVNKDFFFLNGSSNGNEETEHTNVGNTEEGTNKVTWRIEDEI